MDRKKVALLLILVCSMSLVGCGGEGSAGGISDPVESPAQPGGRISSPTPLQVSKKHSVSRDRADNYFEYTATEGETAIIHVNLDTALTASQRFACAEQGGKGGATYGLYVYDENRNIVRETCRELLYFKFPSAGTYTLNIDATSGNSGYFWFTVVDDNSLNNRNGEFEGTPNNPRVLSETGQNLIYDEQPFLGFYQTTLSAGQKLTISSVLTPAFSDARNSCNEDYESTLQRVFILVMSRRFTWLGRRCGDSYTFTAPEDDVYVVLPYYYARGYSGYFSATKY